MAINPSLKILIVDDVPTVRILLREMLRKIGFSQIIEAEDGEMAWEMIQSSAYDSDETFDLVIADWNMPKMSGVDLLRSIRNSTPSRRIPFLMVTAKGDHRLISEAIHAGASGYAVKPFDGTYLENKIQDLFR